jgi:hypothetical protein
MTVNALIIDLVAVYISRRTLLIRLDWVNNFGVFVGVTMECAGCMPRSGRIHDGWLVASCRPPVSNIYSLYNGISLLSCLDCSPNELASEAKRARGNNWQGLASEYASGDTVEPQNSS